MKKIFSALLLAATLTASAAGTGVPVKYGCAYYPEAWPEERWAQDLDDMKELGLSIVRIGEFNWTGFEPEEGEFDFAPYCRFLTLCEQKGMKVMMCTPGAALPPWMHADYPECEKVDRQGHGMAIGTRQTRCPSSAKFRKFANRITRKMAEAFKEFRCIAFWQIDNEIHITAGFDTCHCESCRRGFRKWLEKRYGTIDNLNQAWNHAFWSARFTDFGEIRLPIAKGREPWNVEYIRYQSDTYVGYMLDQAAIIREVIPGAVTTSNGSEMSGWMRLDAMYAALGYAATDTYVTDVFAERAKWMWALSRGLTGKQRPFMVAEIGPFSWDADQVNSDDKVAAWVQDAANHGAEYILFFRWRQSVSGEQYHPAILPWSGKKGTGYRRMKQIIDRGIRMQMPHSGVAILHSNESDQDTLVRCQKVQFGPYEDTSIRLNAALEKRGILPDYLMSGDHVDFTGYKTVFVPMNTIVPPTVIQKLKDYVRGGGNVVAICRLNLLNPMGGSYYTESYPVGMNDLFGLEINEQRARADWPYAYDRLENKVCRVITRLKEGAFAGSPELTVMAYGDGNAYYFAALPSAEDLERLLDITLGLKPEVRAAKQRAAAPALVTPKVDFAPAERYRIANLAHAMCSGFDQTPKGRIWTSWVAGEDGSGAFLIQHYSDDNGKTWSDTKFVVDPHVREQKGAPICSITSNFWTDPQGRMHFFFDQSMGHCDGRAGVWEMVSENPDAPQPTWTTPRRIADGHALNKPIVARDGTWLLPTCLNGTESTEYLHVFPEIEARQGVHILASTDQGKTWTDRGYCHFHGSDWHEPQLVELKDGRLWLLARVWHCHTEHGIMQSFSSDGGRTWSKPTYPALNNPIARFVCRRLASGNLLLVCHGRPDDWHGEAGRSELMAWLSDDEGRTWKGGLMLDARDRVSYPDAFQSRDGSIYVQWDRLRAHGEILFARFTEADILAGKFISPNHVDRGQVAKVK